MKTGEVWQGLGRLLQTPEGTMHLAETWLRIRSKQGRMVPLKANAAQRAFEAGCHTGPQRSTENIVLKARQMGMSTWIAGRFLLKTLLVPGTTTLLVAHTREASEMLLQTVERMWENLPTEMRETVAARGRANMSEMTFPAIRSAFRVASAADANAGRGLTVQNLHCSEVSRWTGDAAETLAGLRAAVAPGGEVVLESTPNGAYGCFYGAWVDAAANGMRQHFLPWWMEPAYVGAPASDLTEEERALVEREGLSAEQVGFRRELEQRYGPMRTQEFAEDAVSCFRESGSCFFEREAVAARLGDLPEVVERRGDVWIWLAPMAGRKYVVAVDAASGGSKGDFAAMQVVDVATGMQCAEFQGRVHPREQARMAAALAREYGDATLVVERNGPGLAVIAYLEKEKRVRLYEEDGQAGWCTDAASRPRMLGELAVLVSACSSLFLSARLLKECRSFVLDERGRAAAAPGNHDDLVMSMAIAQAVRSELVGG